MLINIIERKYENEIEFILSTILLALFKNMFE